MGAFILAFGLAFGVVGGIVSLAWNQKEDPTIRKFLERQRLALIAGKRDRDITLREAEDALALARRHDSKVLVVRFAKLVLSRRKVRPIS